MIESKLTTAQLKEAARLLLVNRLLGVSSRVPLLASAGQLIEAAQTLRDGADEIAPIAEEYARLASRER